MNRRIALFAIAGSYSCLRSVASANVVPSPSCEGINALGCATKIKNAIDNAATAEEALEAWGIWSRVYEDAYRSMQGAPVPPGDLDRFEGEIQAKIQKFTSPENIALDLAIARFFPQLAAILALPETTVAVAVWALLAPSPIETPLQELQASNTELASSLSLKLGPFLRSDWRWDYGTYITDALNAGSLGPKP